LAVTINGLLKAEASAAVSFVLPQPEASLDGLMIARTSAIELVPRILKAKGGLTMAYAGCLLQFDLLGVLPENRVAPLVGGPVGQLLVYTKM